MKNLNEFKLSELMNLPVRKWDEITEYDSLLITKTRRAHESGWRIMMIIGCNNSVPVEIASNCCEDIGWKIDHSYGAIRFDCPMQSGVIHVWSRIFKFRVGVALSSTEIEAFLSSNTK